MKETLRPVAVLTGICLIVAVLLAATNLPKLKKIHPIAFIAVAGVVGVVFRFAGA